MSSRARRLLHLVFAVAGVVAVVALVRTVGLIPLLQLLRRGLPVLPWLLAIEVVRIGLEASCTWFLCGPHARRISPLTWVRTHLVAFAASVILPAGRATSEAIKATMLAPHLGGARAAAVGVMHQTVSLFGLVAISVPCVIGAVHLHAPRLLVLAIVVHALICLAVALAIQAVARGLPLPAVLRRRLALARAVAGFREATRSIAWVPVGPLASKMLNRVLQVTQYALLIHAVGGQVTVARACLAQGVNLVGSALGDLVPAQVGATDGAFALAAPALSVHVADGIAIAMLVHVMHVLMSIPGALLPLLRRATDPPVGAATAALSEPAP